MSNATALQSLKNQQNTCKSTKLQEKKCESYIVMRANQLCDTCLVSVQLSLREMSLQIKTNPKGSGLSRVTVHDE